MQMFNDCIADLGLREIDRIGARFTWTNRQASPTQSVLDRVLVSPEWDLRCPWLPSGPSPGLAPTMSPSSCPPPTSGRRCPPAPRFRFETFWLSQTGFVEAVGARWVEARSLPHPRPPRLLTLGNSVPKRGRQFMKGWGANLGRDLRERKKALLTSIQALDLHMLTRSASPLMSGSLGMTLKTNSPSSTRTRKLTGICGVPRNGS